MLPPVPGSWSGSCRPYERATWVLRFVDPSRDLDLVTVQATSDPERARVHVINEVTIGYVGTDTFDTEGGLVQSADWLDRRSVEVGEHDLMGLSFGTVTLLKYPGIDRWYVHDVIVAEVDWRELDGTPEASPAAITAPPGAAHTVRRYGGVFRSE